MRAPRLVRRSVCRDLNTSDRKLDELALLYLTVAIGVELVKQFVDGSGAAQRICVAGNARVDGLDGGGRLLGEEGLQLS